MDLFLNRKIVLDDAIVNLNAFLWEGGGEEPIAGAEIIFQVRELMNFMGADGLRTSVREDFHDEIIFRFDPATFFNSESIREQIVSDMLSRVPRLTNLPTIDGPRFWHPKFSDFLSDAAAGVNDFFPQRRRRTKFRFFFTVRAQLKFPDDHPDVLVDVEEGGGGGGFGGGVSAASVPAIIKKPERVLKVYDHGRESSSDGDDGLIISTGKDCSICLEKLSEREEEEEMMWDLGRMPCSHVFHYRCLAKWLEQSHLCPLCRYEMLPTTFQPRRVHMYMYLLIEDLQ